MRQLGEKFRFERENNPSNWTNHLEIIFGFYIVCKSTLYSFLQVEYMNLQSRHSTTLALPNSSLTSRQLASDQIRDHRLTMQRFGVVYRESGPSALLVFGSSVYLHLIFTLGDTITGGRISALYMRDTFVFSYVNQSLSNLRLRKTFDRYLRELIVLNTSKIRMMTTNCRLSELTLDESRRFAKDLNQQQAHLRELLADKSSIWPANRDEEWHKNQTSFVLRLYTVPHMVYHFSAALIIYMFGNYCHELLKMRNETPVNIMENLSLAEMYFVLFVGIKPYLQPVILLVVSLRDKRMCLRTIHRRLMGLQAVMVELGRKSETSAIHELDQQCQELACVADREALAIYLNMRVFLDNELQSMTKLASLIVNQYCLVAPSLLVPFLLLEFSSMRQQLTFLTSFVCFYAIVINLVFGVCANLEAHCTKTTQRAWSLVASLTLAPDLRSEKQTAVPSVLSRLAATRHRSLLHQPGGECFVLDQMRASSINAHTALLWRRFVLDMGTLRERFHSTALGSIRLNYSEMLRLNFWFVSVVLTILTMDK